MFIKLSGFPFVKPQITTSLMALDGGKNVQVLVNEIISILNQNLVTGSKGQAITTTVPLSPKNGDYYIANGAGTYTNFKDSTNTALVVSSSDALAYFIYNGTYWTKQVVTIDVSGKADVSTVTAVSASLAALNADVYRKFYIDGIANLGNILIPSDRSAATYPNAVGTATYFGEWSVYTGEGGRILNKINVTTFATGTLTVGFFRIVGGTATLVGKQDITVSATGLKVINRSDIVSFDLAAAEASRLYIGIRASAGGMFRYVDNGSGGTSYSIPNSIVTTAAATTNNFSFTYWIQLQVADTPLTVAVNSNIAAVAANTVAVSSNANKINTMGNMVSGYSLFPAGRSPGLSSSSAVVSIAYYFGEYATNFNPATAPFNRLFIKTRGAGAYTVGFFRITGTTNFVKLAEKTFSSPSASTITLTVADFSGIDLSFPAETGSIYIGLRSSATTVLSYLDIGVAGNGWSHTPYTDASGTVVVNPYALDMWVETGGPTNTLVETVKTLSAQGVSGEINLTNCSKIVCIGDSYTESYYSLRGKSWINVLSWFMDWNFENYGISGFTMPQLITNLRNNVSSYEGVTPQSYNGTYAIIASHTNDYTAGIMNGTVHLETYLNNMRTLCRIVKSLGMIPVMCSEWVNIAVPNGTTSYSDLIGTSLSMLAQEEGGIYIDVLYKAQSMQGNLNTPFFGGNHPGTRSNGMIWYTLLRELQSKLPRPKNSLKLFKLRSAVAVSTVADIFFRDNFERAKLFQEIQVSENRIGDAQANYFDDLDTWTTVVAGSRITTRESEYLKLRKGVAISMTDYSLIVGVLPTDKKNVSSLSLTISESAATVYYKDIMNDAWVSVTNTGGVITLSSSDINKAMDYDKITFLIYKSGGISLTNAKINYAGISEKDVSFSKKKEIIELTTSELLTNQTVVALTNWTVTGSLTPTVDANNVLPTGITRYVDLTISNWLRQTVTFATSTVRRKMQIKALVRTFPTKFVYTDTWPTNSVIKPDSYDFATLEISVRKDTNNIAYSAKNVVPLWNTEVIIECDVPPNITTLDIGFRSIDKTIQFMSASVKI